MVILWHESGCVMVNIDRLVGVSLCKPSCQFVAIALDGRFVGEVLLLGKDGVTRRLRCEEYGDFEVIY